RSVDRVRRAPRPVDRVRGTTTPRRLRTRESDVHVGRTDRPEARLIAREPLIGVRLIARETDVRVRLIPRQAVVRVGLVARQALVRIGLVARKTLVWVGLVPRETDVHIGRLSGLTRWPAPILGH